MQETRRENRPAVRLIANHEHLRTAEKLMNKYLTA
jgi:hypothetical protein